jgi:hypothetical protein
VLNVYKNAGTKASPKFELVSDHFQDIKVGRRSVPSLADMDGDGKPDLLIGNAEGAVELWRNVGGGGVIRFERDASFAMKSDGNAAPTAGDIHKNGKLDVFVGTAAGGIRWFENTSR